jgi:hypothetical protein
MQVGRGQGSRAIKDGGTRFSLQTVVQKSHMAHGKMYDVIVTNTAGTKRRIICYKT